MMDGCVGSEILHKKLYPSLSLLGKALKFHVIFEALSKHKPCHSVCLSLVCKTHDAACLALLGMHAGGLKARYGWVACPGVRLKTHFNIGPLRNQRNNYTGSKQIVNKPIQGLYAFCLLNFAPGMGISNLRVNCLRVARKTGRCSIG